RSSEARTSSSKTPNRTTWRESAVSSSPDAGMGRRVACAAYLCHESGRFSTFLVAKTAAGRVGFPVGGRRIDAPQAAVAHSQSDAETGAESPHSPIASRNDRFGCSFRKTLHEDLGATRVGLVGNPLAVRRKLSVSVIAWQLGDRRDSPLILEVQRREVESGLRSSHS